jgi:glycosyltransferase involved in cell wall biosynthesis
MKILFVLPRMVSGGVERITLSLASEMMANNHSCELALRKAHGELLSEACSLLPVHELAPKGIYQFVPALAELLKRSQPTHVITAFPDVAALTWLALKRSGSQACWIHGVHNTHAPVAALPGFIGRLRFFLFNRAAAFVYRRADAIVAVSDGIRAEILEWFDIDPSKVETIYNPVLSSQNLNLPAPDNVLPLLRQNHPCSIVTIGRLAHQKGFDILIEAMRQVPMPWTLDIWGDGPDAATLKKQIEASGMASTITLRGYTADPIGVLKSADLFVLPSRHEGLPTVLIEALASPCRIVATNCPHGPREILINGRLGRLVPPEDPDLLAVAIRQEITENTVTDWKLRREKLEEFMLPTAARRWQNLQERFSHARTKTPS